MGDSISVIDIINILKKRWKLIVCMTLAAALISGILSYIVMTPIYQASTQILVNQKNTENQLDSYVLQGNIDVINTYSVIIKSPAILEKVIDDLDLNQSVEELNQNITINSQENSQVFSLTVEDPNARKAVEIANTVSKTFQQDIQSIMNVDNVSILAKAELKENPVPVRPNTILNIAIAVVVGLILGMGIAFILEFIDTTLKDDKDATAQLGLPVLGTVQKIPPIQNKTGSGTTIQKVGSESSVS